MSGVAPPSLGALGCGVLVASVVLVAWPGRARRVVPRPADPTPSRSAAVVRRPRVPRLPATADVAVLAQQLGALHQAGLAPGRAWQAVAERAADPAVRAVAAAVVSGARRGEPVGVALRGHLARAGRREEGTALRQLVLAVDVSERTGAALAPALGRLADALRETETASAERASALAGPRASATILGLLPLAGVGLGGALGSDPVHMLFGTGPGRVCLVLGGGLWFLGRAWTAALVRRAARG